MREELPWKQGAASHHVIDSLRLCLHATLSPQPGLPPFSASSKIPSLGHNKTPGANLPASVFPQHLEDNRPLSAHCSEPSCAVPVAGIWLYVSVPQQPVTEFGTSR